MFHNRSMCLPEALSEEMPHAKERTKAATAVRGQSPRKLGGPVANREVRQVGRSASIPVLHALAHSMLRRWSNHNSPRECAWAWACRARALDHRLAPAGREMQPCHLVQACEQSAEKNFLHAARAVRSRPAHPRDRWRRFSSPLISLDYPNSYLTVLPLQGYLSLC